MPTASRDSPALAVGLSLAVLFAVLAIATTVILLVADSGGSSSGVLTHSTTFTAPSGQAR